MAILLDTTVLIDALRGDEFAIEWLLGLEHRPSCSEVTRVEIISGLRPAERATAERLFATLGWVPVSEAIARAAGDLGRRFRRSHAGIGTIDLIVAATATDQGLAVATTNVEHFPMFKGLRRPY